MHLVYPFAYVGERIGDVTHAAVARQRQAGAACATGRCLPGGRRTPCSRPPTAHTGGDRVPARPIPSRIHGPWGAGHVVLNCPAGNRSAAADPGGA
jgi:hypothetical protein